LFNDTVSHLDYTELVVAELNIKYAALVERQQQQKTEVLGEKSVSTPICATQVSDREASTIRGQQLNHLSNLR